jgi:uncharacterized protein YchJ
VQLLVCSSWAHALTTAALLVGRAAFRTCASKGFGTKQEKTTAPKADCPCRSGLPYEVRGCCTAKQWQKTQQPSPMHQPDHTTQPSCSEPCHLPLLPPLHHHHPSFITPQIPTPTPTPRAQTCCKPYVTGQAVAPTIEATVRARFSAYSKKVQKYIIGTTHPSFHAYHYETADGGAMEQLTKDVAYTCDNYVFSAFKLLRMEPGKDEDDGYAEFR